MQLPIRFSGGIQYVGTLVQPRQTVQYFITLFGLILPVILSALQKTECQHHQDLCKTYIFEWLNVYGCLKALWRYILLVPNNHKIMRVKGPIKYQNGRYQLCIRLCEIKPDVQSKRFFSLLGETVAVFC